MTPEQIKQWQKAVMRAYPAPTPDGQECTLEQWQDHRRAETVMLALLPEEERFEFLESVIETSSERLMYLNAPDWVIRFREELMKGSRYQEQLWGLDFALRSGVALVGLGLLYSSEADSHPLYHRVRLRFVHEVLGPFVKHAHQLARQGKEALQICYLHVNHLHQLTKFTTTPPTDLALRETWGNAWDCYRGLTHQESSNDAVELAMRLSECSYAESREGQDAVELVMHLAENWTEKDSFLVCFSLNKQHIWRVGDDPEVVRPYILNPGPMYLYYNLIADAFLTALEAECPRPDWLALELSQS